MDKVRIHELAKVLNTNSKRIIEKLNEIDIHPKGAMSYLEPDEYNKLRQYLGMPPIESAVTLSEPVQESSEISKSKSAPKPKASGLGQSNTIIKRRFINSESDDKPVKTSNTVTSTKRAAANSGLRTGFVVRDDEITYATGGKKADSSATKKKFSKTSEQTKKDDRQEKTEQIDKVIDEPVKKIDYKTEDLSNEKTIEPERRENESDKTEIKNDINVNVSEKVDENLVNIQIDDRVEEKIEQVKKEIPQEPKENENVVKKETVKEDIKTDDEVKKVTHTDVTTETSNVYKRNSYNSDRQINPDRQSGYQGRQGNNQYNQNRGDRPANNQYNQNRGDRPANNQYNQNRGDRPYNNQYNQNRGDRPANNQYNQNRGDRPANNQYNQNRGDRPANNQYNQNRGDRPGGYQGNSNRTDRQGSYQGGQGRQNSYQNSQGRQDRQGGYQNQYKPSYVPGKDDDDDKPAYMKKQYVRKDEKSEPVLVQKAEINAKIEEAKKEAQVREQEKSIKRENKKESAPKGSLSSTKGKRNNKLDMPFVGEKKGVHEVFSDDFVLEGISVEDANKFKKPTKPTKYGKKGSKRNEIMRPMQQPVIAVLTNVTLPESMTVKELAESLKKTSAEIMKKMLLMGIMANVNQVIDFATAEIVADEFGIKAVQQVVVTEEDVLFDDNDDPNDEGVVSRPPVVVVMGHVDHGKTSLLDAIRSEHVVTGEAGGITQHIGAYTVNINDRDITFLDTPGHEAFTAMRARGAQTTDIAILVVAADDGVMPQTVESINHAKAANVSVIVAVNKIDKQGANVERVMQELTEYGLVAEEWGGDTIFVPVSAKKNENIDTLLEMILLTADVMELKASPDKQPKGTVIEAKLDKNRGPVATVLVQRGTLRLGDSVVTGTTVGRIRAMTDDKGKVIKEAGPSIPVEILGLPDVPQAGEVFYGITDEKLAKQLAEKRKTRIKEEQSKSKSMVSLDDLFNQIQEGNIKEINIIVKADVQGSVEAVKQSLEKLSNEDVRVRIIHGAVGAINESDISLAQVSNAMIIGFNVRPGTNVQSAAETAGVDMRLYTVIYNAIEDVSSAMKGMLDPTFKETVLGHAEIRQIYKVSGIGTIAGCYITDGKVIRNSNVRIIRDGIVVHDGKLASLKRFKDDVKEVLTNYECGLSIEKYNDIKESDVVESYIIEEVKRD